jgi:acetyl-CoA C-acetyltransferase
VAEHPPVPITDTAEGPARVVTYTVIHGRDGAPETGLAVCDLPDGTRTYGKVDDADLLTEIEATEWVAAEVDLVTGEGGRNTVVA